VEAREAGADEGAPDAEAPEEEEEEEEEAALPPDVVACCSCMRAGGNDMGLLLANELDVDVEAAVAMCEGAADEDSEEAAAAEVGCVGCVRGAEGGAE
jgi:tryptophan synthase beta subunit